MTLHLTEQGSTLRLRQGRLLLELDEQILAQLPARKVRGVVVWGNVRLTTPALAFLLRQGVPVLYTTLEGQLYGQATPPQALAPRYCAHKCRPSKTLIPWPCGLWRASCARGFRCWSA